MLAFDLKQSSFINISTMACTNLKTTYLKNSVVDHYLFETIRPQIKRQLSPLDRWISAGSVHGKGKLTCQAYTVNSL